MEAAIEVTDLRKRFGPAVALDGLSFTVTAGSITGFVGPNGAGKSTTMRAVLGLDSLDSGRALVGGQPYQQLRHPLSHVGSLLDAAALQPSRSARNHLLWLAHSQGLSGRRVDQVLADAGLTGVARRSAGGFSLGMRQRLGIAAAMLADPPVLMLDEPFNGLDPEGIVWMRGYLRALAAEGRAVLVSSHLMSELQDTATHLVVIGRGRLVADTSVAELIAVASGGRVALRTTARAEAISVLGGAGATVAVTGPETLTIADLSPEHVITLLCQAGVPFSEVSAHRATLEEAYMELTRDSVEYRAAPARGADPMTATSTAFRSSLPAGRDGFAQVLRAEWTKFWTVRGWIIGLIVAVLVTTLISILSAAGQHSGSCVGPDPAHMKCTVGHPYVPTGPGGEAVADTFFFVNQPHDRERQHHRAARLAHRGDLDARDERRAARQPAGQHPARGDPVGQGRAHHQAEPAAGSAYAAVMATGAHGVRMQYNYTHDSAGLPGHVSASAPRWLRLTRSGGTLTGYDSANGTRWTKIGTARLAGLHATVQVGLFATSPVSFQAASGGAATLATAAFDHVSGGESRRWRGHSIGAGSMLPDPRTGQLSPLRRHVHRQRVGRHRPGCRRRHLRRRHPGEHPGRRAGRPDRADRRGYLVHHR